MGKFIKLNDLNKRISFLGITNGKTPYGQNKTSEENLFTCWASIKGQTINEMKSTIGTSLEDTITIVIRYKQVKEIKSEYKILFDNLTYEIKKLNKEDIKKEFITIIAKRIS
jgi:SPP1 family predicted phage head-tail adaptor